MTLGHRVTPGFTLQPQICPGPWIRPCTYTPSSHQSDLYVLTFELHLITEFSVSSHQSRTLQGGSLNPSKLSLLIQTFTRKLLSKTNVNAFCCELHVWLQTPTRGAEEVRSVLPCSSWKSRERQRKKSGSPTQAHTDVCKNKTHPKIKTSPQNGFPSLAK